MEYAVDLRYRLWMLGVPVEGSCLLFGDNQSMITNVTVPGSVLKKRHSTIVYHRIREAIAANIVSVVHCQSEDNLADMMTKALGPQVFQRLTRNIRFPPVHTDVGELQKETEGNAGSGKSRQRNFSHIKIEHSWNDRDLALAYEDQLFRNYVVRSHHRYNED